MRMVKLSTSNGSAVCWTRPARSLTTPCSMILRAWKNQRWKIFACGYGGCCNKICRSYARLKCSATVSATHAYIRGVNMATKGSDTTGATMLGQQSSLPASPDEAVLERVPNPHPDTQYVARFAV